MTTTVTTPTDSILNVSNWKNSAAFKAFRENKAREQEEAKQRAESRQASKGKKWNCPECRICFDEGKDNCKKCDFDLHSWDRCEICDRNQIECGKDNRIRIRWGHDNTVACDECGMKEKRGNL